MNPLQNINLCFGWLWILLGFLSGMVMGFFFHREDWLGGYGSFRRRLYRLAHVSFFGLGVLNFLFYLTAQEIRGSARIDDAGTAMIAGGVAMPICCLVVAHWPKAKMIFAFPVVSLITGGVLTLMEAWKL